MSVDRENAIKRSVYDAGMADAQRKLRRIDREISQIEKNQRVAHHRLDVLLKEKSHVEEYIKEIEYLLERDADSITVEANPKQDVQTLLFDNNDA